MNEFIGTSLMEQYFSGDRLYGDDFDSAQISDWYEIEKNGYFELASASGPYEYGYRSVNVLHGFSFLGARQFSHCVAFGCARGDEVEPIAKNVAKFTCIEPAQEWWRSNIAGTPARFIKPNESGRLPLGDADCDLFTCFGVLHHIPNVSFVLDEIARTVKRDGIILLREPISSMGDWRKPRKGLTRNERGLPIEWLLSRLEKAQSGGFEVLRSRFCFFPATYRIARMFGTSPFNNDVLTSLDWLLSSMTAWNRSYHRDTVFKKIAPGSIFIVARKR